MMARILIAFYSRGGSTEALAKAVAEGARGAGGEVRLRRAAEVVDEKIMAQVKGWTENSRRMLREYGTPTLEDADWADALVFGTPTRYGNVCAELKAFIDSTGPLWAQGKLNGKAGAVFVSTQTTHGGNETTALTLYAPMAHLGLVIVPAGYVDPVLFRAGTPYGASTVSGSGDSPPREDDLAAARVHGARIARVAEALKPLRARPLPELQRASAESREAEPVESA
jgi:NAD(P)H dehydrogenase (quinone)